MHVVGVGHKAASKQVSLHLFQGCVFVQFVEWRIQAAVAFCRYKWVTFTCLYNS